MARKKKEASESIEVTDRESKLRAVEKLAEQLNKEYCKIHNIDPDSGQGYVYCSAKPMRGVRAYSTRVPSLDIATGIGGIPRNRVTEIFGPERSGKTTVALQIAAVAQKAGDIVLYIDAEQALDVEYCRMLGLDVDDKSFVIVQPSFGEEGLHVVLKFLNQKLADLVIVDSLASLIPKSTLDAIMEDSVAIQRVGERARMLTKFIDAAVSLVNTSDSTLLLLQQMRTKITYMGAQETTASPLAVKHEESMRIEMRKVSQKNQEFTGNASDETMDGRAQITRATVVKNKVSKPFRQSLFDVVFGEGADYASNLLATCVAKGLPDVIMGGTGWVTVVDPMTGEELAKFRKTQAREYLRGHEDVAVYLNNKLSQIVGINLYDPFNPDKEIGVIDIPDTIEDIDQAFDQEYVDVESKTEDQSETD